MNELDNAIIKTLVWFDLFDFPLTSREIHRHLWQHKADLSEVESSLQNSEELNKRIESSEAFFFLKGRNDTVRARKTRYTYAERKFKRALRVSKILSFIPWIKMISVCNTLGISNAKDDSDIDLFIITEHGRIWLTRFFVVAPLRALRLRPRLKRFGDARENRKDKIDASFYITDTDFDLRSIAIPDDIYLAYWINTIVPIYNKNQTYEKFIQRNSWTQSYVPNEIPYIPAYRRRINPPHPWIHEIISMFDAKYQERLAERFEMRIMPEKLKKMGKDSTSAVVISDTMLKFHDQDRREDYKERWTQRTRSVIQNQLA